MLNITRKIALPNHHIHNREKSFSFEIEIEENNAIEDCTNDTK